METSTKAHIIKIGNSRGIRIPKPLLEQVNLGKEVELEAQEGQLVIRPAHGLRRGWDELFAKMAQSGDDRLLDAEAIELTVWDRDEWEW